MVEQFCPECGGVLFYDAPVRRYVCRSCGLYATKDEIADLRAKVKSESEDKRKKKEKSEYLEWWLSKK